MQTASSIAIVLTVPVTLLLGSTVRAQSATTERVSLATAGTQGNASSYAAAVSGDGRFIAFQGSSTNLVPGVANGTIHVYVRDRLNATTECVSVSTGGAVGDGTSLTASITADGRFVAYCSYAINLVASDTNGNSDIFVRDRLNGTTERVNLSTAGSQANADTFSPSISSADGRYVAFYSGALQLVPNDSNNCSDIFVRDRTTGATTRASIDSANVQSNAPSYSPSICGDGHVVAFESNATNLVASDTNGVTDVFVRDRTAGTTVRASVATSGAEGNGTSSNPSISADGRYIAFQSEASNLVVGDSNGVVDIFVRDSVNATTERASLTSGGVQGNLGSDLPSISGDSRYVTFESLATNLVSGDTNGVYDVFIRDRYTGLTTRVSVEAQGAQANNGSSDPSASNDGRFVAFHSDATNLVLGDSNALTDAFVRDRGVALPVPYCTAGTSSVGCIASISANANPSVSQANACNLVVTNVEGQKSGILFYGINNTGFVPGPWASGSTSVLCVKHPTQRTPIQNSGGVIATCNGSFVLDWNAYQSANPLALGNPWSVVDKVYAQAWFRDPPAAKATNLSNAVEMTYVP